MGRNAENHVTPNNHEGISGRKAGMKGTDSCVGV